MAKFKLVENPRAKENGYRLYLPNGKVQFVPGILAHRGMKPLTEAGLRRIQKRQDYDREVSRKKASGLVR